MNSHDFVADYLYRTTGFSWDVSKNFDISGLDKISIDFWAREIFHEIEFYGRSVNAIYASHRSWFKDIPEGSAIDTLTSIENSPVIGTLYGAGIHLDGKIPKHIAIACSNYEFQQAVTITNGKWLEEEEKEQIILPKISKFQWMQKQN